MTEWFHRFAPLKDSLTSETVCIQIADDEGHRFASFPTPQKLYDYVFKVTSKASDRLFYETIIGDNQQKPHFDLDIPRTEALMNDRLVVDDLIEAISDYMVGSGLSFRPEEDLRIYSSHGEIKSSYHIIMPNHHHLNHVEAKEFYKRVLSRISLPYRQFIDRAVYSKLQQFRLLGCTKYKANRTKVIVPEWHFGGETGTLLRFKKAPLTPIPSYGDFIESCISVIPPQSSWLYIDLAEEDNHSRNSLTNFGGNLKLEPHVQRAYEEALRALPSCYEYDGHRVTRVGPGYCEACKRTHGTDSKGDNAFITVEPEKGIYLRCYRSPAVPLLLAPILVPNLSKMVTDLVDEPWIPPKDETRILSNKELKEKFLDPHSKLAPTKKSIEKKIIEEKSHEHFEEAFQASKIIREKVTKSEKASKDETKAALKGITYRC